MSEVPGRSTAAIMQPTYLPWIGYFDLMDQVDLFVLLDSVQYEKRSWQSRNRVKGSRGPIWLTVPVKTRGRFEQKICEVEIDNTQPWAEKHWLTLERNYRPAPYWSSFAKFLESSYHTRWERLVDLNLHFIGWMAAEFGITTPFVRSSELKVEGKRVDLLLKLCRAVGATAYISPVGSAEYIETDNRFAEAGIELRYQHYEHPHYRQRFGEFISHLSAVDLLLNEGEQAGAIMRSGRRAPDKTPGFSQNHGVSDTE